MKTTSNQVDNIFYFIFPAFINSPTYCTRSGGDAVIDCELGSVLLHISTFFSQPNKIGMLNSQNKVVLASWLNLEMSPLMPQTYSMSQLQQAWDSFILLPSFPCVNCTWFVCFNLSFSQQNQVWSWEPDQIWKSNSSDLWPNKKQKHYQIAR